MGFNRFKGKIAEEQDWLNRTFLQLYEERPVVNDMMLARDRTATVIFDGECWREFDLRGLNRAVADGVARLAARKAG